MLEQPSIELRTGLKINRKKGNYCLKSVPTTCDSILWRYQLHARSIVFLFFLKKTDLSEIYNIQNGHAFSWCRIILCWTKIEDEMKVVIWNGWIENKGQKQAFVWYNLHSTATFAIMIADYWELEYTPVRA